ncbi:MAG: hypothetical protein ACR2O4_00485 [Hyphomicrobiaceae bacterium]
MKLSTNLKIAAVILGTLPAALGTINSASAADDPTSSRINRDYQKCVKFSKRVLQSAVSRSNGDRAKINAAYAHYRSNTQRCRSLLR